MWKWRERGAATSTGLGLILLGAGCGNTESALTLPQVRDSMNAAGLRHPHVLTGRGIAATIRGRAEPGLAFNAKGQPVYLQVREQAGLLIVRIPQVSEARRVISKSRTEHGGGFTIRVDRVCNVLVVNYLANDSRYSALASRTERELRRRCR